jgi:hypothetical protein
MPVPTRPVAGAPIESAWGQAVHDSGFKPVGCRASAASTTTTPLPLTAVTDPAGMVGSNRITIPANREGLYLAVCNWSAPSTAGTYRLVMAVNGTIVAKCTLNAASGVTNMGGVLDWVGRLVAGDYLDIQIAGVAAAVSIDNLTVTRLGDSWATPAG